MRDDKKRWLSGFLERLRNALEAFLYVVLAGFAIFVLARLGRMLLGNDPTIAPTAVSSFFGALFAFVLVRIGEVLNRLAERARRHADALVVLQQRYHDVMNTLSDQQYMLAYWARLLATPYSAVWTNRLQRIEPPRDELRDLDNIDLLNELSHLNTKLRRLSDDLEGFNRTYERVSKLLEPPAQLEAYKANLEQMNERRKELEAFVTDYMEEVEAALAAMRVLVRRRTLSQRLTRWLMPNRYPADFESRRNSELSKLKAEAEALSRDAKGRIESTIRRASQRADQA